MRDNRVFRKALLIAILAPAVAVADTFVFEWDPPATDISGQPTAVDGYRLYLRSPGASFGEAEIDTDQTSATIEMTEIGQYLAAVSAYNQHGEGPLSNEVDFAVAGKPPAAPSLRLKIDGTFSLTVRAE
jgi:hypothetical protein